MKKSHKFFERFLNNDLDKLHEYLVDLHKNMLYKNIFNIPTELLDQFHEMNGAPTRLGHFYDIFSLNNQEINNLKQNLKEMCIDACDYYGYDFNQQKYYIHGWFNIDFLSGIKDEVSPLNNPNFFHDHLDGHGMPYLHGYYCVNAEPSITYYKINKDQIFENINKNNRAIISETGHPHGRDDWYIDKPRITIAYDIRPFKSFTSEEKKNIWTEL